MYTYVNIRFSNGDIFINISRVVESGFVGLLKTLTIHFGKPLPLGEVITLALRTTVLLRIQREPCSTDEL
ncbi:hypothetical protein GCM10009000_064010 [Halobacterium noricense]|uniref:Uncharacterized protein n=1 Tax=Haladaptatus pallidirubidus TaxID=1008152 RepID=A0AAV3UI78_9EURY